MANDEDTVHELLCQTAETLAKGFSAAGMGEYGYLVVVVKAGQKDGSGVNYATNFLPEGLEAVGKIFAEGSDDDPVITGLADYNELDDDDDDEECWLDDFPDPTGGTIQ